MKFSATERQNIFNSFGNKHYDLIIIGGGITGAGIALDATLRGLNCLLLEKQDFAAGTSSRSTKLIHGGLRYLKQLEFGLVKEVGTERAIIHHNARHLVRPQKMLLPIVKNGTLGKYSTSLALMVYDWLANVENEEKRKMLSQKQTIQQEPLLNDQLLTGGGLYYEYLTDDARLTIETLKTAVENGAEALNYTEVTQLLYDDKGKIAGVTFTDTLKQTEHTVNAEIVVNATGPWVDKIRSLDETVKGKKLQLTKGIHIVISKEKLPIQQALYFDVGDKRMIFAIPRQNIVYIGTTDTFFNQKLDRPKASKKDVEYLLDAANKMFKISPLTINDVISSWVGLRPLIYEEGKNPSELSRKDEIFYAESGLISIAGGKLTGFRKMAERTVNAVVKKLNNKQLKKSSTESTKLSGSDFNCEKCLDKLRKELQENLLEFDVSKQAIEHLLFKYGSNAPLIVKKFKKNHSTQATSTKLLIAELEYCLDNEMVVTSSDFLIRRTGRLYFNRQHVFSEFEIVHNFLKAYFNWSEIQKSNDYQEFINEYNDVLAFSEKVKV